MVDYNSANYNEVVCEAAPTRPDFTMQFLGWECNGRFISASYRVRLSPSGKGGIVFNISQIKEFTIAVENDTNEIIEGYLAVSPNQHRYKMEPGAKTSIESEKLGVFVGKIFLKYTAIELEGPANGIAHIYFQGQY